MQTSRFRESMPCASAHGNDDDSDDGDGTQESVTALAHALAALRAQLGKKFELYAAGPVAEQVAARMHKLPSWPVLLGGSGGGTAALLLLDRSRDVSAALTPACTVLDLAARELGNEVRAAKSGAGSPIPVC